MAHAVQENIVAGLGVLKGKGFARRIRRDEIESGRNSGGAYDRMLFNSGSQESPGSGNDAAKARTRRVVLVAKGDASKNISTGERREINGRRSSVESGMEVGRAGRLLIGRSRNLAELHDRRFSACFIASPTLFTLLTIEVVGLFYRQYSTGHFKGYDGLWLLHPAKSIK